MIHYSNYLNGQFADSTAGRITVLNPSTGEAISTIPDSLAISLRLRYKPRA
jgi:acyl-CoA reductase-like NAD-dependent aldehyde dehydrogenase